MEIISKRGGSRIGWVGATWPLASLRVAHGTIELSSMGKYAFTPNEVTAVEPVGAVPFLSQGIRIHHTKMEFPERVEFYTLSGRRTVLEAIETAGFRVGQPAIQIKRGFPLRWSALAGVVVLWNVLFLLDRPNLAEAPVAPGPYSLLALATLFALATLLPNSQQLQRLFMRDGRDVGEISGAVRLVQLISGVMLLGFAATYFLE